MLKAVAYLSYAWVVQLHRRAASEEPGGILSASLMAPDFEFLLDSKYYWLPR